MAKRKAKPKPKQPPEKRGVGRPSDYDPAYAAQAAKLCELGATDVEIANFFEVGLSTFYRWQTAHPEFREAIRAGKGPADERVERSLFLKATGYTFDSEKVFQFQGAIVRANTREHVPPDTTAAIFWLKNRRSAAWRDKQDVEHSGTVTLESLVSDSLKPGEGAAS